jgi:ubiquinone/menaquinone biosynthesis C-methylase UbiE
LGRRLTPSLITRARDRHRRRRDVDRFDTWADTYDRHWLQIRIFDPAHAVVVHAARRRLDSGAACILDIGCGTGKLLRRLRETFPEARLIGVDPAPGMVEAARRQDIAGAELLVGDAQRLPFADGSVDLVVTTMSFHHWRDQPAGLREVRRVLRPSACVLIADITLQWWMIPFAVVSGARRRVHTLAEFQRLFTDAGFVMLESVGVPGTSGGVHVMAARRRTEE